MSKIYVTGDTHGTYDRAKLNTKIFKDQKDLTKNDYVIICGDVGMIWNSYTPKCPDRISSEDKACIKWYNDKNFTTLFVDGNHENHYGLTKFPIEEWNGGKIHRISDTVIHLMRGQVFNIDGKKFFTMGGAFSIDKLYRREGYSWWPEEMPSQAEYEEAMANLEKNNFEVDYVISHCCGTKYLHELFTYHDKADTLTRFFDHLEDDFNLKFKYWYFGHHHVDMNLDDKHTCLYRNVVEI